MKAFLSIIALARLTLTAAGQSWVQTTSLPDGYAQQSLVYASGFLYQTGGASDSNAEIDGYHVFYAQVYSNGTIGSWNTGTPLPEAVFEHAGVAANGFVYVLGGVHYNAVDGDFVSDVVNYSKINSDGSLGAWQTANPLPQDLCYLNVSVWNNTIYVAGGASATMFFNTVYSAMIQSDGSLSVWVTNTSLPTYVFAQGGGINGFIYSLGGVVSEGAQVQNNVNYSRINADGTLASWNQTTPLPQKLSDLSAVAADGRIFVMGGWNGSSLVNGFYSAPVAGDGTLGAWAAGPSLPNNLEDMGVAVAGSYLFVSGGEENTVNSSNVYSMALPLPPVVPTLVAGSFTNGNFQLQLASSTNTGFGLLASPDLIHWTNLGWGFTGTNGFLSFQDTNAVSFPNRFYRAYWPLP